MMRGGSIGLVMLLVATGCTTTPPPTAQAATVAPTKAATPAASPPAFVSDGVDGVTFTRPASWSDNVPTHPVFTRLWLSSEPLSSPCDALTWAFPIACLPGGVLPDGGVLVVFSRGGIFVPFASAPLPLSTGRDDSCAAAGGHNVSTRLHDVYIGACLRGALAEAAYDAFYRSLH
jgi:hypothetical protein